MGRGSARNRRELSLPLDLGLEDVSGTPGEPVQVVVDVPTPGLPQPLTYLAPPDLKSRLRFGSTVLVPLRGREQIGYVVGTGGTASGSPPEDPRSPFSMKGGGAPALPPWPPGEIKTLRPIAALLREESAFEPSLYALVEWVARETHAELSEALRCIAPESQMLTVRAVIRLITAGEHSGRPLPYRSSGAELSVKALPGGAQQAGSAGWGRALASVAERVRQTLIAAGGQMELEALRRQVPEDLLPAALRRLRRLGWIEEVREVVPPRVRARWVPAVRPAAPADVAGARRLGPQQQRILNYLSSLPPEAFPVPQRQVCEALGVSAASIRTLVTRGLLLLEPRRVSRLPMIGGAGSSEGEEPFSAAPPLLPDQECAVATLRAALGASQAGSRSDARARFDGGRGHAVSAGTGSAPTLKAFLLFGVTGSGKTEVYLHACEAALADGRRALFLVPEISLTAQVVEQFRQRFGDRVGLIHSRLSDGERFDEWERIRKGEVDVVLGPRSALFAPARDVGLIVVDEEHDGSYKQESAPRYLARDVAQRRAELEGAVLLLGSATPAVETFYRAEQGEYHLLPIPERVHGRPLPEVEIIDLRAQTRTRPGLIFGQRLEEAVREALSRGEQAILFLNRRGFSTFILCRDCGYVARCPNCNVALTLHQHPGHRLLCHHCAYSRRAPTTCPRCAGMRIRHFGIGTERVEAAAREAFPGARIARLDRDTTARKDSHARIVKQFRAREADLLIGTQMVAKGFDFPNVTLVGVITADTALNLPDFRAAERSFQLLSQVSGRAGRGERAGRVIIQTFSPDHFSIRAAARHDYMGFYRQEIENRRELAYPPFTTLARLVVADASEEAARGRIHVAAQLLAPEVAALGVQMLGPCSAPLTRINRKYRWHLLLKSASRETLQALLGAHLPALRRQIGSGLVVDVDPQSVL